MTPEQIDLLPCPFCGGKAHMASEHDADTGGKFYFITCASCRAKGQESYARETCPIFFGQVRDAWNRRASPVITALAEDAARAHDLALENARLREALKSCLDTVEDYLNYTHDGDPWTEDARAMGEMDINDFKNDGRLDRAVAALDTHAATAAVLSARDSIPEGE
jgi:hypothetical protein